MSISKPNNDDDIEGFYETHEKNNIELGDWTSKETKKTFNPEIPLPKTKPEHSNDLDIDDITGEINNNNINNTAGDLPLEVEPLPPLNDSNAIYNNDDNKIQYMTYELAQMKQQLSSMSSNDIMYNYQLKNKTNHLLMTYKCVLFCLLIFFVIYSTLISTYLLIVVSTNSCLNNCNLNTNNNNESLNNDGICNIVKTCSDIVTNNPTTVTQIPTTTQVPTLSPISITPSITPTINPTTLTPTILPTQTPTQTPTILSNITNITKSPSLTPISQTPTHIPSQTPTLTPTLTEIDQIKQDITIINNNIATINTNINKLYKWNPKSIQIMQFSHTTGSTHNYNLNTNQVPSSANQILIGVSAFSGYINTCGAEGGNFMAIVSVTVSGVKHYHEFYTKIYPQNSYSWNSDTFWFPVSSNNRRVYVEGTATCGGPYVITVKLLGWR